MGKHAYLMIVNDKVEQLSYCIQLLDHPKNDIYILVDEKSDFTTNDEQAVICSAYQSSITFLPRFKIYWGGILLLRLNYNY